MESKARGSVGEERLMSASNLECFSTEPLIDTLEKYSTLLILQNVFIYICIWCMCDKGNHPPSILRNCGAYLVSSFSLCILPQPEWDALRTMPIESTKARGLGGLLRVLQAASSPRRPEAWTGKEEKGDLEGCQVNQELLDPGVLLPLSWGPFLWLLGGLCGTPVGSWQALGTWFF